MKTTRELADLFSLELFGNEASEITSVAMNTAAVAPGSLFVAVQGQHSHGLDHIAEAISKGACAVLSDRSGALDLPNLFHPDPRAIAGLVAAEVFGTAESGMALFAVTGTNGKTSTVFYLSELLQHLNVPTGLVSSALVSVGGKTLIPELTTPEAPRVHQLLSMMRANGQTHAAIEASAQGLSRGRLNGLHFKVAGFTNLSRDHLDDYPDMDSYLAAKARLFSSEFSSRAVILLEDEFSRRLFDSISIPKVGIGSDYHYEQSESGFEIWGKQSLSASISLPQIMAKNLALACVMVLEAGFSPEELERALPEINLQVPGRLQRVSNSEPAVYVDYAHTPAAVAASASELTTKHADLTILLAASGDRDRGKRAEMARAAASYASFIIVTDQHPRSEDPAQIRAELISAISDFTSLEEIADPAMAIKRAIEITKPGGAVLWCGPGHLKYREVQGRKLEFDAVQVAREALGHDRT